MERRCVQTCQPFARAAAGCRRCWPGAQRRKGQRFSSCRHKVWGGSGVIPKEASGGCKGEGKTRYFAPLQDGTER